MNTYDRLTTAEKRTVDMTVLGAFCVVNGTDDPGQMHALRHAHAAVDTAVASGNLSPAKGDLFKEAMTDTMASAFVALLDAERAPA